MRKFLQSVLTNLVLLLLVLLAVWGIAAVINQIAGLFA